MTPAIYGHAVARRLAGVGALGATRMPTRPNTLALGVQLRRSYATASLDNAHSHTSSRQKISSSPPAPDSAQGPPSLAEARRSHEVPTISNRSPLDDNRKHEDWVLYHPVYTPEQVQSVKVTRHEDRVLSDKLAGALVQLFRKGFDVVTGYRHSSPADALRAADKAGKTDLSLQEMRAAKLVMDDKQWLARILFLESIAGVPGMVAGTLRHLRSLRLMKRDGGFIHQLLEEAENERMHLMTFMKISNPGLLFRLMILGAQGVFYNLFFLSYLFSPRVCHRFVGKLEEEAVVTYTNCIAELEAGRLPEWENLPAPRIAIDYWRMKEDATLLDVIYAVRADEAGHRFFNHTMANIQDTDFNPFAIKKPDGRTQGTSPGFSREQGLKWYDDAAGALREIKQAASAAEARKEGEGERASKA